MKVVPPVEITPAKVMATNVPDSAAPVWSPTATYSTGDKVRLDLHEWEALADVSAGVKPGAETLTSENPAKWLDLGYENKWRMFYKRTGNTWYLGTHTENPESIDITITPGVRINSIGIVGVQAATLTVQMIVDGEVVYEKEQSMSVKAGGSWYRYYFGEFQTRQNFASFDLPAFGNAQIRIIASAPLGTARIGMMVMGMSRSIGWARWGTQDGFDSYSTVREDEFGNQTIIQRGTRDYVAFDVAAYRSDESVIKRTLNGLNNTAALYIGSDDVDSTIIIGRFERLQRVLSNVALVEYSLEVRSLM